MEALKELLEYNLKAIADKPDEIEITEVDGGNIIVFNVNAAKEDLGKIIGRQGKTATALRTILKIVAARNDKKVVLEIVDKKQ